MSRTEALWVSEQGEALLPNGVCRLLRRPAERAEITGMHPHRFRHSYAINALRAGVPEQVLKIVGGWRKIPETYFKTFGGGGRYRVSPAGEPGRPARAGGVGAKRAEAGSAKGEVVSNYLKTTQPASHRSDKRLIF